MDRKAASRNLKTLNLMQQLQDSKHASAAQALAKLDLDRQELLAVQTRLAGMNLATAVGFRSRLEQISKSQKQHEADKAAALRELRRLKGVRNGLEELKDKFEQQQIEKEAEEILEEWTASRGPSA